VNPDAMAQITDLERAEALEGAPDGQPVGSSMGRRRVLAFVGVALLAVLGAIAYLLGARAEIPEQPTPQAGPGPIAGLTSYVAFRASTTDDQFGRVAVVPWDQPDADPTVTGLSCERIHMSRFGGVCLAVDRAVVTTAKVLLLGPDMSVRHTLSTAGIPSRARVSPDGRWAATTTFVFGHAYAGGSFSTLTEIYDMGTGQSLGSVEDFSISRDGQPCSAADVNVWGVTFADDGRTFYATVMSDGKRLLTKGDIPSRHLDMTDIPAECPSLSPSGKLVAYKSATGPQTWQINVRAVDGGSEVTVSETRSIDDQIEWLDEEHVLYGLDREGGDGGALTDIWMASADGSGVPSVLVPAGWSPAAVRPEA